MRKLVRACGALAIAGAALASPAFAEGNADPTQQTASELFQNWSDQASAIETSAAAAQRQGDAGLAQQLFLLGAMTGRVAGEFRNAEQYSLTTPISDLPAPVPERIKAAAAALAAAAAMTDANANSALNNSQAKFNALLAAIMNAKIYPVLYGMIARDLSRDPAAEPADIMIYGFDILDRNVHKTPNVSVGQMELPDSAVSVKDDVLLVTLPPEVKTAIGFSPSPCDNRKTFNVRTRAYYALKRGFWPLTWQNEQVTVSDFNALATPIVYTAKVAYSVDSLQKSVAKETFQKKSSFVSADCDRTVSTAMTIDLPAGAQDVTCQAHWVDTSSAQSAEAHCRVENAGAKAEGTLGGVPKICTVSQLCSCVSSAHGWLEATGTYQRSVEGLAIADRTLADAPSFGPDSSAAVTMPLAPGETLRGLSLAFTKRACANVMDTLDVPTADVLSATQPASSRLGGFRALYRAGRLVVGGAGADAFNTAPSQ